MTIAKRRLAAGGAGLLFACCVLVAGCGESASKLRITVPAQRLLDQPAGLVISGARAGSKVVVLAQTRDRFGATWQSSATFIADRTGSVSVARDASVGGSYRGRDPSGLLWSLGRRGRPTVLTLLRTGLHIDWHVASDKATADAQTLVPRVPRGVAVDTLRPSHDRLVGYFFHPRPGPSQVPILLFGGSEGGIADALYVSAGGAGGARAPGARRRVLGRAWRSTKAQPHTDRVLRARSGVVVAPRASARRDLRGLPW